MSESLEQAGGGWQGGCWRWLKGESENPIAATTAWHLSSAVAHAPPSGAQVWGRSFPHTGEDSGFGLKELLYSVGPQVKGGYAAGPRPSSKLVAAGLGLAPAR